MAWVRGCPFKIERDGQNDQSGYLNKVEKLNNFYFQRMLKCIEYQYQLPEINF